MNSHDLYVIVGAGARVVIVFYEKGPARQPSVDWGREASSGKDSGIEAHILPSQTLCLCQVNVVASRPPGPALYFYLCTPGTPGSLATQDNRMGSLSWVACKKLHLCFTIQLFSHKTVKKKKSQDSGTM